MKQCVSKYETKWMSCIIAIFFCVNVYAQAPIVKAQIDSTAILIGEQTRIRLEVAANKEQSVQLPVLTDTIMRGVEILEVSKIDTVDIGNNRVQYKFDYLVTSFDSALYLLPSFKAISGIDTVGSKQLALKVSSVPVDVDNPEQYYDIKDVIKPEFVLKDYLNIILYILLGLLVILAILYFILRKKGQKPMMPFKKEEPELPPHVRAIQELDSIKAQKMWQQGRIKEYHSEISDTLRKYIEERFGINAMEMTSGEILDLARRVSEIDGAIDNLKQILQLADFVKFAKYKALPDENELSLMNAYLFVNNTKKEEIKLPEPTKEEQS